MLSANNRAVADASGKGPEAILANGFHIVGNVISHVQINDLLSEINSTPASQSKAGIRNAEKKFGLINTLTSNPKILAMARRYLNHTPQLVRALLFIKNAENNWLVPWHQDKTVCVTGLIKAKGWGAWTMKDDVLHVQPPLKVLNRMVSIRIHLDAADADNGGLKVIPGSHRYGIVKQGEINGWVAKNQGILCSVPKGAAMVMSPLLLHASEKARGASQRRVIHLEYSDYTLPEGVSWA